MVSGPVAAENLAVCVAINDKDHAWYEMLVPFILSLRRTGYAGHVAVIGFGLSPRKVAILRENGLSVFEATEPLLSVGRYLEVAKLCEANPGLQKIALYDADIWFCGDRFDLFEAIHGENLFACRDAMFCNFVTDRLIGAHRDQNVHLLQEVARQRIGGAVQAGLVAGTREAWSDFADHVRHCQDRVGIDFDSDYGFDTTILQLWAAHGRIDCLSPLQNYVARNGVGEQRAADTMPTFSGADGPIRGLHMTSDIRFLNCWRYFSVHRQEALTDGAAFALASAQPEPVSNAMPDLKARFAEIGLDWTSGTLEPGGGLHAFRQGDQLHLIGIGNHELILRAARPIPRIVLDTMYFSGAPGPIRAWVRIDEREIVINRDSNQWLAIVLAEGSELSIRSESLAGQMSKVAWIFSGDLALYQ